MITGTTSHNRAHIDDALDLASPLLTRRRFLALAAAGLVSGECLARTPRPAPHLTPEDLTVEVKVRLAQFIFVGLARRVFYVNPFAYYYQGNPIDPKDSRPLQAILDVRVLEPLFPGRLDFASAEVENGSYRDSDEIIRGERYLDKLFIYFVHRDAVDLPGRKYIYRYSHLNWSARPEPFERREEVVRLIRETNKTGPETPAELYRRRGWF